MNPGAPAPGDAHGGVASSSAETGRGKMETEIASVKREVGEAVPSLPDAKRGKSPASAVHLTSVPLSPRVSPLQFPAPGAAAISPRQPNGATTPRATSPGIEEIYDDMFGRVTQATLDKNAAELRAAAAQAEARTAQEAAHAADRSRACLAADLQHAQNIQSVQSFQVAHVAAIAAQADARAKQSEEQRRVTEQITRSAFRMFRCPR